MDINRRRAVVFLVLGMAFNTIGITQPNESLKISFISLGIVFLVIAIIRFLRIRKEKNEAGQ